MITWGYTLKALASTNHRHNAGQAKTSPLASMDGDVLENAFWDQRHVGGRKVTTTDVFKAYDREKCSLRCGHFFKKLYLREVRHQGEPMTAEKVLAEFNRKHDLQSKCSYAVALFKGECCIKKISLHGRPVNASEVADSFPGNKEGKLGLARFRESCCLKHIPIHGRPVTPESVVNDFEAINARLELARFKEACLFKSLTINGRHVSPQEVIDLFQATGAHLELARFKEECFQKKIIPDDRPVPPEEIVDDLVALKADMELAHFKAFCCLEGVAPHGQPVSVQEVVDAFQARGAQLDLAHFKAKCVLEGVLVDGRPISVRSVVNSFPTTRNGRLGLTNFKAECHLTGLLLDDQPIAIEGVVANYQAIGATLELALFKAACCERHETLNGRLITPDEVVRDLQQAGAALELARFKSTCCLQALPIAGRPVTPEEVADSYKAIGANRELARFRQSCFENNLTLYGEQISPESLMADLKSHRQQVAAAHFKAKCCLEGRRVHGQGVSPEAVIKAFPKGKSGKIQLALFLEECCLRGLYIHHQPVSPAWVLETFRVAKANKNSIGRFKENCCARGLLLNDRPVSPELVLNSFGNDCKGILCIARFKELCYFRGFELHGRLVAAEKVISSFPDSLGGKLCVGRFMERCCLRGFPLFGKAVTPEAVMDALEKSRSLIAQACFRAECCLKKLRLHEKLLSPEEVVASYPPGSQQQKTYFKRQCCLKGLKLDGRPVPPEDVVRDYERETQLLEKAVFLSELALQARQFNGKELTPDEVLDAFSALPGDCSSRKVEFLIQRLMALLPDPQKAVAIFERAWQIINNAVVLDEQLRYQRCTLLFLALSAELPVNQEITTARVWRSIKALRQSFSSTRLRFYFLVHCFSCDTPLNGQPVVEQDILDCLGKLPISKLRSALRHWFDENYRYTSKSGPITDRLASANVIRRPKWVDVYVDKLDSGLFPSRIVEYYPETPALRLDAQTKKILSIVQTIKGLRITGSFARCLQGLDSSFNDIDLIGTEDAISTLITRLSSQLDYRETGAEIPCRISALALPGCPSLGLPMAYSITLVEGDFGCRLPVLQAIVYPPDTLDTLESIEVQQGDTVLTCLLFSAEVRLMIATVQFLNDHIDSLTTQLLDGKDIAIPRTLLFNYPRHSQERVFALLMRCLMTLNKAQKFCQLVPDDNSSDGLTKLKEAGRHLLVKVQQHSHRTPLVTAIKGWLADSYRLPTSSRENFVRSLLAIIDGNAELF